MRASSRLFNFMTTLLLTLACATHTDLRAETTREKMRTSAALQRNSSFSAFMKQHGKLCEVLESQFAGQFKRGSIDGDLWWVRCSDSNVYAILISGDENSTSWFMPCDTLKKYSEMSCFQSTPKVSTIK